MRTGRRRRRPALLFLGTMRSNVFPFLFLFWPDLFGLSISYLVLYTGAVLVSASFDILYGARTFG